MSKLQADTTLCGNQLKSMQSQKVARRKGFCQKISLFIRDPPNPNNMQLHRHNLLKRNHVNSRNHQCNNASPRHRDLMNMNISKRNNSRRRRSSSNKMVNRKPENCPLDCSEIKSHPRHMSSFRREHGRPSAIRKGKCKTHFRKMQKQLIRKGYRRQYEKASNKSTRRMGLHDQQLLRAASGGGIDKLCEIANDPCRLRRPSHHRPWTRPPSLRPLRLMCSKTLTLMHHSKCRPRRRQDRKRKPFLQARYRQACPQRTPHLNQ